MLGFGGAPKPSCELEGALPALWQCLKCFPQFYKGAGGDEPFSPALCCRVLNYLPETILILVSELYPKLTHLFSVSNVGMEVLVFCGSGTPRINAATAQCWCSCLRNAPVQQASCWMAWHSIAA